MAEENKGSDNIRISKDTLYGVIIAGLAILLVLSVLTQGFGIVKSPTQVIQGTGNTTNTNTGGTTGQVQGTTQPSTFPQLTVTIGNYPVLGQSSAPVSVVEFSDFQCPFCGQLYGDAEAGIRTNYVNSGKVNLYFRDFPLTSIHPNAMAAAVAARCANDQGKFWEMHDQLFSNQNSWVSLSSPESAFEQYAVSLGLNNATFSSCYKNSQHTSEINADEAVGQQYGVQGTPGVYILIPKSKISASTLQSAVSGYSGGLTIYENSNQYVVFVAGAYPYSAFDAVLSKVSY